MSAIEQIEDLEHRVLALEREVQLLKSRLRDRTISESLNGVDVVRGQTKTTVHVSDQVVADNIPTTPVSRLLNHQ